MRLCRIWALGAVLLLTGCAPRLESLRVKDADLTPVQVGESRQVIFQAAPAGAALSEEQLSLRLSDAGQIEAEIEDVADGMVTVSVTALAQGEAEVVLVCDDLASQPYPLTITLDGAEEPEALPEVVYVTPTGKRYHFSASCAGENAIAVSIDEVGDRTPCKTCT